MKTIAAMLAVAALIAASAQAKIYFHEDFNREGHWARSDVKPEFGAMHLSSGDWYGDKEINQGFRTGVDAKNYAYSTELPEPVTNKNKDLVISLSVKHEQGIDCGGGYIKLLPAMDPKEFHGDSEYSIMFGPDQCGFNKRVHLIFNYKGENLLWKKEPKFPDDKFTHVYTVRITPNNKYELYIDQELKESGLLETDWAFLKPKEIDDPTDKKPADWVDEPQMDDPTDKKPADWDLEPATIADPEAKKPDDWDDEEDGAWEAPQIPNPKAKGTWRPKRIPNPGYKGVWKARQIPNPAYTTDDDLYLLRKPLKHVGIDIWQVHAGTIFDNIIIGDDLEEVNEIIAKTWGATKDAEKTAFEAWKAKREAQEKKAEDDRKARETEAEEL